MLVLGLETSCDETAAAIVGADRRILADCILSQTAEHRPYGGVVPEIAARAHLEHLDHLIRRALDEAGVTLADLDGIAATGGPGLIGGVIVGTMTGKALAAVSGKPFLAVNHLEGHALVARLTNEVPFPYLLLLVSGGHCQLLIVRGVGDYQRLGTTIDDAVGEAFDKAAKLLGLGYPGGPLLEQAAQRARQPERFALPRPLLGRPGCDFSFSGLKTAVRRHLENLAITTSDALDPLDQADLAAAFQQAVSDSLADRCAHAITAFRAACPEAWSVAGGATLVAAGGVAANSHLRARLTALADAQGLRFVAPPPRLCTDNGTMIAWAGLERLRLGQQDGLDFAPRPRWPLGTG